MKNGDFYKDFEKYGVAKLMSTNSCFYAEDSVKRRFAQEMTECIEGKRSVEEWMMELKQVQYDRATSDNFYVAKNILAHWEEFLQMVAKEKK